MNVKALSFGIAGFIVFATIATLWIQHDMREISAQERAETIAECQKMLSTSSAGANAEQLDKCAKVGVTLGANGVVTDGNVVAGTNNVVEGAAPITEGNQVRSDAPKQKRRATVEMNARTRAQAPKLDTSKPVPGRTAAETNAARRNTDHVITPADSKPIGEAGYPSQEVTKNTPMGPPPDALQPDNPLDGKVSSVLLG